MPIYEYRCTKGHTFETLQSMSDAPLTKCEVCGAPVQRVMHSPAVHFKGSGFYNTDYGTRNRQREQKANSESSGGDGAATAAASSSSSSSSSSDGDSKPAADKPAADKPKTEKAAGKSS
jgi:putative FmdB family regulatory protein